MVAMRIAGSFGPLSMQHRRQGFRACQFALFVSDGTTVKKAGPLFATGSTHRYEPLTAPVLGSDWLGEENGYDFAVWLVSIGKSAASARPRWLKESLVSRSISAIVC